jgi:pyruvate/2-oxoglutarate dehydrogenase complex dihydrolipoamide acyltransferase (E2) component
MKPDPIPYHVVDLAPMRRAWLNILDLPRPVHSMYGLLEVDVTTIMQFIARHKQQTGEALSFTGYLTYCLGRAIDEDKSVQAYLKGRKQFVIFEDVNVGLMVERQVGETRTLTGYVVQAANRKSYRQIHDEIRKAQTTPASDSSEMPNWFRTVMTLPWPFSSLVKAGLSLATRGDPGIPVGMSGSVGVTAVGMFGKGHSGWGLEATRHSLDLIVGSICTKPWVVEGRIEPREILNLTVVFDHYVVDGAPAARFVKRLVELVESGHGLDEIQTAEK